LVQNGKVRRAYLGVGIQAVTQSLAPSLGVSLHEGVAVTEVFPNSPAAEAGLKPGDVIVKYAGQPVSGPQQLQSLVEQSKIGQKESLEVLRDGKRMTLEVPVREQPADYGIASRGSTRGGPAELQGSRFEQLGIEVSPLSTDVANQLGLKSTEGVVITSVRPGSLADLGGLETGMVILQANRKTIKTVDDLAAALQSQPLSKGVLLLVRTAEGTRFVVIRADKQ
jgi:serine protease Do